MSNYVSARFVESIDFLTGTRSTDRQVVATDDAGGEWFIPIPHEECQVGDWLRFVEAGGRVEAYSGPETQPA